MRERGVGWEPADCVFECDALGVAELAREEGVHVLDNPLRGIRSRINECDMRAALRTENRAH